jgi:hypothetical protein
MILNAEATHLLRAMLAVIIRSPAILSDLAMLITIRFFSPREEFSPRRHRSTERYNFKRWVIALLRVSVSTW